MNTFYKVRVKVSLPSFKPQFIDGLYIARETLDNADVAKMDIINRIRARLDARQIPVAVIEVVLFRRSDISFVISDSQDLEN